ncbi:MAG: cytochrome c oxidase subunit I [Candidatus Binatus sp.]|uniref:cytochrome c oxidase subunit I n=1 Tax=Candidatus Binatus sp. TaxID=2811406 RepID=UPI00271A8AB7|nr:cytochrome c oxidase subunit I [Candidatus Binatus sp.]MDO8432391.1 cytochrome c oxidase subunit I [Candidatus Binatus sp.]
MAGSIEHRIALSAESDHASLPILGRAHEWVVTVDHKRLGLMYIGGGLVFFLIAGLQAATMRLQLAIPNAGIIAPQVFNRLLTVHGTAMVFLVGMPILTGFLNYLVPLMIGARDLAFPRLNAFGFWLWLFGSLLLYFSYIGGDGLYGAGSAPDVGWFAYAPLTERAFSRGNSTDYWILSILLTSVGSTATAINLLTSIFCMRCEGMTLRKMPVLVWLAAVVSFLMCVVLPPLSAAQAMLLLDRFLGAHFFDTQAGGSAILWQHFFWIFGHPEVYVLVLPAFAFANEIIPVFSRKVIFGYSVMVAASCALAFISLGVWAHHMFSVGMAPAGNAFFAASTMLVSIPTGIKIFNWIGTMWGGKIRFRIPMMFSVGFLAQFLIAGLTGIMLAVAPFDWQLTDTYFVVAHFHYVLIGAIVFMIFAAIYYWFPKATGKMLGERLGKWHFWLFLIGFHMTFDTLHFAGLRGMPRRIYTYQPGRGLDTINLIASIGVIFQAAGILMFLINVIRSLRSGKPAGDDPWDAWTLEWSTSSPPPEYNFAELPVVRSRRPLWDLKHPEDPDWKYE